MGKGGRALPPFSGDKPIVLAGATMLPQSLWVAATTLASWWRGSRCFSAARGLGKGILATAHNRLAAQLVGVDTRRVLTVSFGLSAALGAIGGVLIAPIANTSYDAGRDARAEGIRRRDHRRARLRPRRGRRRPRARPAGKPDGRLSFLGLQGRRGFRDRARHSAASPARNVRGRDQQPGLSAP